MALQNGLNRPLRHFLDIDCLNADDLRAIIERAKIQKQGRSGLAKGAKDMTAPLSGDVLLMIFQKASTRTRISFEIAMKQLGGSALDLDGARMQLGRGETIADTARVLSRYGDAIVLRTDDHRHLLDMADNASIPVINALTDHSHPCQIMADILTFEERLGSIAGKTLSWIGDGNNVATSMIHAAGRFSFRLQMACPPGHEPSADILDNARKMGADIQLMPDARAAVTGSHAVYTDTWRSMGQGREEDDLAAFDGYQVTDTLLENAEADAIFMHCLPAHCGQEVTRSVLEGPRSAVWDQAENRVHAQKAILTWCFGTAEG